MLESGPFRPGDRPAGSIMEQNIRRITWCVMMPYPEYSYRNRKDAGRYLALRLISFRESDVVVFAVLRGGVPVAVEVARELDCDLDIIAPRKIPIPHHTEAGYGAVTEDGIIVLNEPLVRELHLTEAQIRHHAQIVSAEIARRKKIFQAVLEPSSVTGKKAIIVDDGIASGYTMVAAVRSLGRRGAQAVVAAAPVASGNGWEIVSREADQVVCPVVSSTYPFAVAGFYEEWHDLTDDEVMQDLEKFKKNRRGKRHD
ncbi:MAG: phosphoribosyltransferase [Deltaproteobacteria bacterium HGW-Deltaproteobacteria-6]|nr:MAG: phosphoribosyltransferase [Deltaproteobacteria bacterium HGW-Deltaproteobacteria-6]